MHRPQPQHITNRRGRRAMNDGHGVRALCWMASIAASTLMLAPRVALASHPTAASGTRMLCATLQRSAGQGQIMDPSRTQLLEMTPQSGVPCGAWASVGPTSGNVSLQLRSGHHVQLGPNTFVQITSNPDQVVLYRGQLYAQGDDVGQELRVLTPNARARVSVGKAIVIYSEKSEESQLVSLEEKSSLENRFATKKKIFVKAGEATSLNFKVLRLEPSTPKAVSVAALKEKLQLLPMDEPDRQESIRIARERSDRVFPALLTDESSDGPSSRAPASQPFSTDYSRHTKHSADPDLRNHLVNKTLGLSAEEGLSVGEAKKLVAPKSGKRGLASKKARVVVEEDPAEKIRREMSRAEAAERKKVVQELEALKPE